MGRQEMYLGIDVASRSCEVAVISTVDLNSGLDSSHWQTVQTRFCKEDFLELEQIVRQRGQPERLSVAVEASIGFYGAPLIYFLYQMGAAIYTINSSSAKHAREHLFGIETKSDTIDSKVLAYLLYLHDSFGLQLQIAPMDMDMYFRAMPLRTLVRLRQALVRARVQVGNRLHQLLAGCFPEANLMYSTTMLKVVQWYPTPDEVLNHPELEQVTTRRHIREEIGRLASVTVGIPGSILKESIQAWAEYRATVDALVRRYTTLITRAVQDHPYGAILLSFPGIGPVGAAVLIGIIQDINRWSTKGKLKKACGLYGVEQQSGEHTIVRRGLSGNRDGKRVLFQLVASALRHRGSGSNDFTDYYERQKRAGKPTIKAMYKTAAKALEIIYYCLWEGVPYRYIGLYRRH